MSEEEVIFKDFTVKRKQIVFGISGVKYHCIPAIGVDDLQEIANVFKNTTLSAGGVDDDADVLTNIEAHMAKIHAAFRLFLQPDSYADFQSKLKDRADPVDPGQLLEIIQWVIGKYTKGRTAPSSTSSHTSPTGDGGTGSTAGAQLDESTPWSLVQLDSST